VLVSGLLAVSLVFFFFWLVDSPVFGPFGTGFFF